MKLQQLYNKLKLITTNLIVAGPIKNNSNYDLHDLTTDSRLLSSSGKTLFLTNPVIPNRQNRNQSFIKEAIKCGALVIICQSDEIISSSIITDFPNVNFLILDINTLSDYEVYKIHKEIIKLFYPGVPKYIGAVTGTNGKTSVVGFTRQILGLLKFQSASLGTLGLFVENTPEFPKAYISLPPLTSLDPINFHKCLDYFTKYNINYLVCEASSHGLVQHRLDGIQYDVGVFTNFTQDHLDYHQTMDNYFDAKCLLFSTHVKPNDGTAIIHSSICGEQRIKLLKICQSNNLKILAYGANHGDLHYTHKESLSILGEKYQVNLKRFPDFQIENILAAIGIIICFKIPQLIPMDQIINVLEQLNPISGRAEYVGTSPLGGKIYIDFAHTPDSIETILKVFRSEIKEASGKLRIVFGAGGNRDSSKRKLMGQAVRKLANHAIVTDDNPRNEDPAYIRSQIIQGIQDEEKVTLSQDFTMNEFQSRREAIEYGIRSLRENDILVIAGKGAEEYQIIGDLKISFNDKLVVEQILKNV